MNSIDRVIPIILSIEPTSISLADGFVTFDDAGVSFDQSGYTFDGITGSAGVPPRNTIESQKPTMSAIDTVIPQGSTRIDKPSNVDIVNI